MMKRTIMAAMVLSLAGRVSGAWPIPRKAVTTIATSGRTRITRGITTGTTVTLATSIMTAASTAARDA